MLGLVITVAIFECIIFIAAKYKSDGKSNSCAITKSNVFLETVDYENKNANKERGQHFVANFR